MAKCSSCGDKYDIDEAALTFNTHFDGEFDYYLNGWENYCADCAISNTEMDIEEGVEDGNVPICAAGCGGYPESCMGCDLGGNK